MFYSTTSLPASQGSSLFPSHFVPRDFSAAASTSGSSLITDEWLLRDTSAATRTPNKSNIMAPVLKSTSPDYWLGRDSMDEDEDDVESRPPVAERVPDPFLTLWLANPTHVAVAASSNPETGESSPKKARIEWPKFLSESTNANWLTNAAVVQTAGGEKFVPSRIRWPDHLVDMDADAWLADKKRKVASASRAMDASTSSCGDSDYATMAGDCGGRIQWPRAIVNPNLDNWLSSKRAVNARANDNLNTWLVVENCTNDKANLWPGHLTADNDVDNWLSNPASPVPEKEIDSALGNWLVSAKDKASAVDAWLVAAMEEVRLENEDADDDVDVESSIEVLEAADEFDLESAAAPEEEEDEDANDAELAKWLVIN